MRKTGGNHFKNLSCEYLTLLKANLKLILYSLLKYPSDEIENGAESYIVFAPNSL